MGYSEANTKAKLITPKLKNSGWTEFHINRIGTLREIDKNFDGITQMIDEYFELRREIYR